MIETAKQAYFVPVQEIETPALLLDLDVLESNIAKMAQYFATVPATLRAHCKNHKMPIIAQKQIDAGAKGICVAKLGEAEVMVAGGIRDILITTQVVDPHKIGRLVNLNKQADVKVVVDDPRNVAVLSAAAQAQQVELGVLVEVNVGLNRCGVEPGQPALDLAQQVACSKGLRFLGVQGYEGHTCFIPDLAERKLAADKAMGVLMAAVTFIQRAGLEVPVVSAAGTGTWNITSKYPGITECQCGSYVTMSTRYNNVSETFGYAVTVLSTVLSRRSQNRAVIDAGNKSMTFEYGLPLVKGIEGAKVAALHVEHAVLALDNPSLDLAVGDKIELIPSFDQTTINLYDRFYAIRKGWLEAVWKLEARGRSD